MDNNNETASVSSSETDLSRKATVQQLKPVFSVPVKISAILGKTSMVIKDLLSLEKGQLIELDKKAGQSIDIYVNDRLIARGEVVLLDGSLGISMTEIIKEEHSSKTL